MFEKGQEIKLGGNCYQLQDTLPTQGGHACVWLARCVTQEGQFVVKYPNLKPFKYHNKLLQDFIGRAKSEADLLRQFMPDISTNHLCPLLDSGMVDTPWGEVPVLVLPYLPSKLPEDLHDGKATYSVGDALRWLRQIAQALQYLHSPEQGHMIHRDLKPGNILLDSQGDIRLIDLGITKPARQDGGETTSTMLTTQWAAPEQMIPVDQKEGERLFRVSTSADIYSLGLLAYYWLSQGKLTAYQDRVITRGHATLGNQYWEDQQKKIRTWEESLTDLAVLTEGKRKNSDQSQFVLHLQTLLDNGRDHISANGTLMGELPPMLPDAQWFSYQCWHWVSHLLAPLPADRPDAQQVIRYLDEALLALQPRLDALGVEVATAQITAGECPHFTITLQGEHLPPIGGWLQVVLDGGGLTTDLGWQLQTPAGATGLVSGQMVFQLQLPAMPTAGQFELMVVGAVEGQESLEASCTFSVVQTAGHLWGQGQQHDAARLEPRPVWLDELAQQLNGSLDDAYRHLLFLRELQQHHPDSREVAQQALRFSSFHPTEGGQVSGKRVASIHLVWALAGLLIGAGGVVMLGLGDGSKLQAGLADAQQENVILKQQVADLENTVKQRDVALAGLQALVTAPPTPSPTVGAVGSNGSPSPVDPEAILQQAQEWLTGDDDSQLARLPGVLQPLVDLGNSEAMRLLGAAYYLGKGIKEDKAEACRLFKQAKGLGNKEVIVLVEKICS